VAGVATGRTNAEHVGDAANMAIGRTSVLNSFYVKTPQMWESIREVYVSTVDYKAAEAAALASLPKSREASFVFAKYRNREIELEFRNAL
jgi:hypothetical protein